MRKGVEEQVTRDRDEDRSRGASDKRRDVRVTSDVGRDVRVTRDVGRDVRVTRDVGRDVHIAQGQGSRRESWIGGSERQAKERRKDRGGQIGISRCTWNATGVTW